MLLIHCPWCGDRAETEFHYGGQAHVAYPADPNACSDAEWAEYLFFRDNPKGPFTERWCHRDGCRQWFNAVRDTRTHRFLATYRADEPRPAIQPAIEPDIEPDSAAASRPGSAAGSGIQPKAVIS